MKRSVWMVVLLALAVALPTWAQLGNGRTGIPVLDNPQGALSDEADNRLALGMASTRPVGVTFDSTAPAFPTGRGWTVENRAIESDIRQSPDFGAIAQKYPYTAQRLYQEQTQQRLRLATGITAAQTAVGMVGVYDGDWIKRVSAERSAERGNSEVNQGSLPLKGALQRSAVLCEYGFSLTSYKFDRELWYDMFRGVFLLSVTFRDTASGQVIASFTSTVTRAVALRRYRGNEYSYPVLPPALDLSLALFTQQLKEAVAASDRYVQANRGRVPFKYTNGYAWLTVGRQDGLVGSNDGAQVVGSQVKVTGANHAFIGTVYQTGENTAFLSVTGLTTADQELLGQKPAVEIVRAEAVRADAPPPEPVAESLIPGMGATIAQSLPRVTTPAEELAGLNPGSCSKAYAELIAAQYSAVAVALFDEKLPLAPQGLKWLRVTSPQAATWQPGQVILAVQFVGGKEASRFHAIVVTAEGVKALVWMSSDTRLGDGEWAIGTAEPLCLTLSTALPGSVIAVPEAIDLEAAPLRLRWVDIHPSWFPKEPVRGMVLVLRREVAGQPAIEVKAVVLGKRGEMVRCAYGLPEQQFDPSWKAVVTPPTTPPTAPIIAPPAAVDPPTTTTWDLQGLDPKSPTGRFLLAAALAEVGTLAKEPAPSFRNLAELQTGRPQGVGLLVVPIRLADRSRLKIGLVVRVTRTVGGDEEWAKSVVVAHAADPKDPGRVLVYVWAMRPLTGTGWQLQPPPGVTLAE